MTYTDSSIYKGEWLNGVRHGKGEYKLVDGTVYKGDWAYDKFNGKGTLSISYINYTYNGKETNCHSVGDLYSNNYDFILFVGCQVNG